MERRPEVDAPRAVPALPASVPAAPALCLAAALVLGAGEARAAAVCSNTPGVGDTILCTVSTSSTGNIDIDARNLAISTAASRDKGVEGRHLGQSGDVDIDLTDGSVAATGNDATGIEGFRSGGTGRISITTENLAVTAGGAAVSGTVQSILAEHNGTSGDVDVDLTGGSLEATTDGSFAYGVYGLYNFGSGGISITTKNLAVTATSSQYAYGLFGRHRGSGDVGDVSITTENTAVTATGGHQYAYGLYGRHSGSGGISITTKNAAVTATGGQRAYGVFGWHTGASGDLDLDLAGGSVTATATQHAYGLYGVGLPSGEISITTENLAITATGGQWALGVYGYHYGAIGAVDIDLTGGSVAAAGDSTYGIRGRLSGSGGVSITARDLAVTAEGLAGQGLSGSHSGLGSVTITTDAEAKIKAPFSVGVQGASTSDANEAGRVVIDSGGATEAREVGVSGWAARSSGHTFGEGAQTADDASRTEPMIHVTSSGDVTVGPSVTDAFIRSRVAGADGTLSTAEQGVLDAIVEDGDSDALDTALDALPAAYDDDYKAQAREFLRKRGFETANPASLARLAAAEILAIPRAGVRAMALSHFAIADHVRNGDLDPAILAVPSASRTTQQRETLAEQGRLSDAERAVLEAVLTGGDVEAALDPLPVDYTDEWKDGVRQHAMSYNAGDIRVDVTGGTIVSEGHGVDARYAVRHERNGAIEVSVAEGASVTGGAAGIHVAGAGLGDLARDSEWGASLKLAEDADVTGLRRQFVTVHGTVTGGTDAAVHLAGGGALLVGETGKVHAGSSGVGVLMDGLAHVHIQGEVKGAEGEDAAAVHLTGGGSVRVGETGRVLANGAAAAIRADNPDGDTPAAKVVLELGVSEGVEDNGGVAREDVQSLLERVKGPIAIENDDGSRGQPVIALGGGAAPGAILEGDVLNEDGTLGGGVLDPERFSWGPCPASQESEDTGVCRARVDVTAGTTIERDGHGVDATGYEFPRLRTGAIEVTVAEGATVTGGEAGIYVEGADLGDLARDSEWARRLNLDNDADVTGLRQQFVTVHGTVRGGTDAAVHLVGGGMLWVGETGKVLAGSSGNGVLVNDPGVAHVHVEGEVRGAEGGAAAVHLTGGGSVRVGETGRVLANGAAAAIRADDPGGDTPAAKVVLELGVSEGVEDNGGVAREDVQSLLERVRGPIAIENDDGSRGRPVIALVGAAAPGAILEGDVLKENGTLGGGALDPEMFSWGPCAAGQESENTGVCRVQVDVDDDRDGRPDSHGIDASYVFPDYRNGAIEVSVAEGATVTGAVAGIYVEGAGLGDVPMDWRTTLKLEKDADVTGLRQQFVTAHGTVTGGTDAAIHLVGGGMLYVGPTGKVLAGSSGNGVLVNDPGVAHVHVEGEVKGAEGGAAAVHLTGGGSVRVGETGRVLANGAAAAIRADDPDGDTPAAKVVLELGVSEGVEDNGGVAREDVQSLLERVKGPIAIENDDGSRGQPVIALGGGAAPGAILEGDVLNEDGTLGGSALDPEMFSWGPCPAGQERGDGDECRDLPPPPPPACPAGQERGDDDVCRDRDLPPPAPPACPAGQERGDDDVCRTPPQPKESSVVGFDCDTAADDDDPRCRLYQALPSMLLAMNDLPTYEERMSAARGAKGGWARVEVADGKWKADSSTQQKADASKLLENVAYDHRRHGVRAGMDFAMGDAGGVGVSVHGLRGSAEMALVGEVDLSGRGLGLHATTAFAGSFHVDAQAAVTWYDADLESASSGVLKKNVSGRGLALGVEIGRRMALRDGLSVAPRAGLTWSKANLDDFAEDLRYGARVSVEDARSLKGRVGVGVEKMQGDAMDGTRLFGSLDLEQEFEAETEARVSGMSPGSSVTSLKAKAERTAYRLAVGGARVWGEGRYSLRGSVGYSASGGDNRDLGGGLSFVMRF